MSAGPPSGDRCGGLSGVVIAEDTLHRFMVDEREVQDVIPAPWPQGPLRETAAEVYQGW